MIQHSSIANTSKEGNTPLLRGTVSGGWYGVGVMNLAGPAARQWQLWGTCVRDIETTGLLRLSEMTVVQACHMDNRKSRDSLRLWTVRLSPQRMIHNLFSSRSPSPFHSRISSLYACPSCASVCLLWVIVCESDEVKDCGRCLQIPPLRTLPCTDIQG